ncbi:acyl-CoA dehydrogenase family protein [Gordonia sp. CPCC 206044]|uniref:acyl-CoA dehydrogenase family protein n=1 Tax=Gordonia sp. CPCC 206044 TaxID=3140793 RepID=UPI003AF359D3
MSLTHDEAVERARALAPNIAARAREAEAMRRPHDDTIAELIDADLMQILTPKRWGGHELSLDTHRAVVEIVSAACMSTGWVFAFYIGHSGVFATRFSEQAQNEFFADRPFVLAPATTSPTTRAERADGGWLVTGKVPWGTGIMHADWVIISGIGSDKQMYSFAMPVADVRVDDVWHMAGMAATGSNDIVLDNVFVPDHRVVSQRDVATGDSEGTRLFDNPIYHAPLLPFLYAQAMPVFSGALRGAANSFEQITHRRVGTHGATVMKDNKYAHIMLGQSKINAHMAERLVVDQIRQTEQLFGERFSVADRARLKGSAAAIVEHCRTSVNEMAHSAGSSSFSHDVPLQRFFRDINMLATHAFWDWEVTREQVGRVALELPPTSPLV